MTIDITTLESVRTALDEFTARFDDCIKTRPSRKHFGTYLDGQLSGLSHKSIEAIAQQAGVAPRTLQEFLATCRWDDAKVRRRLQEIIAADHADPNAVVVIDETGMGKRGDKTPGGQRQYNGESGKVDTCVVTVNLAFSTRNFHALFDNAVFLPKSWSQDRKRCRAAGIPDDVVHRPKWRIGLELLDGARGSGADRETDLAFRHVVADEAYGAVPGFRDGVAERGCTYVVEVPSTMRGWIGTRPQTEVPARRSNRGRPPSTLALAAGEARVIEIRELATAEDQERLDDPTTWMSWHVKDTQRGPQVWDVRVERFWPSRDRLPEENAQWLIVAVHALNGARKYFLSNAPIDAELSELLEVAFGRWHIERCFRDSKQQIGLGDFELRTWRGLNRHLTLSMVSLLFLAAQTRRLRGEKPGHRMVEPRAGEAGCGSTVGRPPALVGASGATERPEAADRV